MVIQELCKHHRHLLSIVSLCILALICLLSLLSSRYVVFASSGLCLSTMVVMRSLITEKKIAQRRGIPNKISCYICLTRDGESAGHCFECRSCITGFQWHSPVLGCIGARKKLMCILFYFAATTLSFQLFAELILTGAECKSESTPCLLANLVLISEKNIFV